MVPTLDDQQVFGRGISILPTAEPRAWSKSYVFGDAGDGGIDGGARGMRWTVSGTHYGTTIGGPALADVQAQVRTFQDGRGHVLTDNLGLDWPNTLLESFVPTGRAREDAAGFWHQAFTAVLLTLGA